MRPSITGRTAVAAGLLGTGGAVLISLNGPVDGFHKVYEDRDVNVVAGGTPVPLSPLCAEALELDGDIVTGPGDGNGDPSASDTGTATFLSAGEERQKLQFEHASLRSYPGGRWRAPAMFDEQDVVACVSVTPGNLGLNCPGDQESRSAPDVLGQACAGQELRAASYVERAVHVVVYKR